MQVRPERGLARWKALGTQLESFQSLAGTASRQNRQRRESGDRVRGRSLLMGGHRERKWGLGLREGFLT